MWLDNNQLAGCYVIISIYLSPAPAHSVQQALHTLLAAAAGLALADDVSWLLEASSIWGCLPSCAPDLKPGVLAHSQKQSILQALHTLLAAAAGSALAGAVCWLEASSLWSCLASCKQAQRPASQQASAERDQTDCTPCSLTWHLQQLSPGLRPRLSGAAWPPVLRSSTQACWAQPGDHRLACLHAQTPAHQCAFSAQHWTPLPLHTLLRTLCAFVWVRLEGGVPAGDEAARRLTICPFVLWCG